MIATLAGVFLAKFGKLNIHDAVTLGIEVGTQNATMAILIAVTFLSNSQYAIAGGVYGVSMYLGALILIILRRKGLLTNWDLLHIDPPNYIYALAFWYPSSTLSIQIV